MIRLTSSHRAKIEEKPEVKKAGGVYYTPTFVVEYIVRHTLGETIKKLTPSKVKKFKVCDPACGSGSFLLGAYQFLLDWHRDYYVEKGSKNQKKLVFQGKGGEWRLSMQERKRILLDNIFGVDVDAQAVEVTKLSLLLKVLEGEDEDTLNRQLSLLKERALPDLGSNIRCGNSIIGTDYYRQTSLSQDDFEHTNPFNWEDEFPQAFNDGGFDSVIGNPPYVRIQRIPHAQSDYIYENYSTPSSKTDISLVFLEKSFSLLNNKGTAGMICTSQWMSTDYGRKLRGLFSQGHMREIVDFGSLPVFKKASTYPAIFLFGHKKSPSFSVKRIASKKSLNYEGVSSASPISIRTESLDEGPWNLGFFDLVSHLESKSEAFLPLSEFGKAYIGTKSGSADGFVFTADKAEELDFEADVIRPYAYHGAEVNRYTQIEPKSIIIYPYTEGKNGKPVLIPEPRMKKRYPNVYSHLLSMKSSLQKRRDSRKYYAKGPDWYRHLRAGSFNYIHPQKLTLKGLAKSAAAGTLAPDTCFDGANCPSIIFEDLRGHDLLYFLALFNSRLISFYLKTVCPPKLSGYIRMSAKVLSTIPIRILDKKKAGDRKANTALIETVQKLIALKKRIDSSKIASSADQLWRQYGELDNYVQETVYDLYRIDKATRATINSTFSEFCET